MWALGTMHWSNIFFAHWRVPVGPLASRLPAGLALQRFHGRAWVTIAAMRMRGPAPGPRAPPPLDPLFATDQIHVRTYVTGPDGPGIFILDAVMNSRLQAFFGRRAGLAVRYQRSTHVHRGPTTMSVLAPGLSIYADIPPEKPRRLRAGSRAHFLTERNRVYAALPSGLALLCATISHAPWRLRKLEPALALPSSVAGFPGAADPDLVATGPDLDVTLTSLRTHVSPMVRELRAMAAGLAGRETR